MTTAYTLKCAAFVKKGDKLYLAEGAVVEVRDVAFQMSPINLYLIDIGGPRRLVIPGSCELAVVNP